MRNWAGTVAWNPEETAEPGSIEDVVSLVRRCQAQGRRLRPIGSGHSFTPIAATDDVQVDLARLSGVVDVDVAARQARVRAGTALADLGPALAARGVAQENLGDIDRQSIAGAVATGTHGTGLALGSISTQVESMTVVTPDGELREWSSSATPDLLEAARVSLGLLGVVVEITLRVVPAYRLRYRSEPRDLDDMVGQLLELARRHRHVEFFWLPHTDRVQAKVQDITDEPTRGRAAGLVNEMLIENVAIVSASEVARAWPAVAPRLARLMGHLIGTVEGVDASFEVFASRRWPRFNEMEYAVPLDAVGSVIEELRTRLRRDRFAVHLPIEVRTVRGDGIWLSPAYGRDSAYVAVHTYRGMPFREYFLAAEEVFLRHDGRPHWGKVHSLRGGALRRRYPRWDDFLRLRADLDPTGMLLNPYFERLLEV